GGGSTRGLPALKAVSADERREAGGGQAPRDVEPIAALRGWSRTRRARGRRDPRSPPAPIRRNRPRRRDSRLRPASGDRSREACRDRDGVLAHYSADALRSGTAPHAPAVERETET